MTLDLFEFEAVPDGGAEGAAPAAPVAPDPIVPAEPVAAEAAPVEPVVEAEPWAGPSQEEWEATQAQLAEAREVADLIRQAQYAPTPQPEGEPEIPEFDMFDPDGVRAHDQWLLQQIEERQQRLLSPILEERQNAQAVQWTEQTFGKLGVPEDPEWREAVLFSSAGFQQFDSQGRPLVHPEQATRQAYEIQQRFAEHIRADERAKIAAKNDADTAALAARAGAPVVPSGPAGGEGIPEGMDEIAAARLWRERQNAQAV